MVPRWWYTQRMDPPWPFLLHHPQDKLHFQLQESSCCLYRGVWWTEQPLCEGSLESHVIGWAAVATSDKCGIMGNIKWKKTTTILHPISCFDYLFVFDIQSVTLFCVVWLKSLTFVHIYNLTINKSFFFFFFLQMHILPAQSPASPVTSVLFKYAIKYWYTKGGQTKCQSNKHKNHKGLSKHTRITLVSALVEEDSHFLFGLLHYRLLRIENIGHSKPTRSLKGKQCREKLNKQHILRCTPWLCPPNVPTQLNCVELQNINPELGEYSGICGQNQEAYLSQRSWMTSLSLCDAAAVHAASIYINLIWIKVHQIRQSHVNIFTSWKLIF